MAETVDLLIFPSVQKGMDVDEVKEKLIKTLRVDSEKVDAWFDIDEPTAILQNVDGDVADRYVQAITNCGAECKTSPTGESGLSLIAKTTNKNTKLFICPSCEYDEEIPLGTEVEQCPKCGLVIAKWEERMAEEAEKEKIRRRLLRQARLAEDGQADIDRKRKELERLKALEREIMKELGLKPPGALWVFYEKYAISMSFAITSLIIMATGVTFFYVDQFLDQQRQEELVAAPPSEEIQEIAPVLEAAVQLQQTGNEQVASEIADVSQVMRGQKNETRAAVVKAAQQMMKGAEPEKFIAMAAKMQSAAAFAKPSPGDPGPAPVNIDTIGGISGLTGVAGFDPGELAAMSPLLLENRNEELLKILAEKQMKPDPLNPNSPQIIVEAIDEMDGSKIVDIMNTLKKDQEWDQFLAYHTRRYLNNQEYDKASELLNRIRNPVLKVKSLGDMMADYLMDGKPVAINLLMARVRLELDKIKDADMRATSLISLGEGLSAAGSKIEPESSLARVEAMAADTSSLLTRSFLHGRLAVAYLNKGNKAKTRLHFEHASRAAGQISEPADRISAFLRIAHRYFDVRNTTLANEILAEAEILAATQLDPVQRARVFGEIAMARGYMGDFIGANMAINNAGKGDARQQLLARLVEVLIADGRYFEAMGILESLQDSLQYTRLELRVLTDFTHSNRVDEARQRLAGVVSRARQIISPAERGLMLSRLARIAGRLGESAHSEVLFDEAAGMSSLLEGRKSQINLGLVALDQARLFRFAQSQGTLESVTDIVVRDPIGNEIAATERTARLLPESLWEKVAGN
jgi:ribosomal protein L37AE/L43A